MKPEEAKEKWCPFIRGRCLDTACMMWRRFTMGADEGYCSLAGKGIGA